MTNINAVAKKLLMKTGQRWLLFNAPKDYSNTLLPLPVNLQIDFMCEGLYDGIQLFVHNCDELITGLKDIKQLLTAETILWVIYPKKSSGIKSDLEMTGNWTEPAKYGLSAVAAASVDSTWTALRFRPEGQSRISTTRNSELSNNEFGAYIDVTNKTITLPADIDAALQKQPLARTNFENLSYTNKKEYVLWILTAKQEKTKAERLEKMINKLLDGKKNPSDKKT
jgi:hypothetical protein